MRRTTPGARSTALLLLYVGVVLVVSGGLLFAAVAGASAQSVPTGGNSTTATPTPTEDGEFIDNATTLVSAEYDSETGRATLEIRSETIQSVTLSDGGALVAGGEVNQREVQLRPGETTTVTLDVTKTDSGFVGVAISTPRVLYAVPIESGDSDDSQMFEGTPGWGTVRTAGIGSGLGVLLALGVEAYRRRSGGRKEVKQRA